MQHSARSLGDVSLCRRLECQGCEPLAHPTDRTSIEIWLRSHARDLSFMNRLRRIVASEGFSPRLSSVSDDRVLTQAAQMLAGGSLLICGRRRGYGPGRAEVEPPHAETERLLHDLPNGGKDLRLERERFRLIHTDQWRQLSAQEEYRVLPTDYARALIERMAATSASASEKRAFEKAASLLAPIQSGRIGAGLLLLSIAPVTYGSSSSPSKPAVTPSQLAQTAAPEVTWVELELLDDAGLPIAGAKYVIVAPNGQEYSGVTDAKGRGRVDRIPPGQCKITFPSWDSDAWSPA